MNQDSTSKPLSSLLLPGIIPPEPPSRATSRCSNDLVKVLFKRFSQHYGASRMAQHWNGQEPAELQGYWSQKIRGITPEGLEYVLNNLPTHPPTPTEFMQIAQRRPQPAYFALPNKATQEERELCKRRSRELVAQFGRKAAA